MRKIHITIEEIIPEGNKIGVTRTILQSKIKHWIGAECRPDEILGQIYDDLNAELDKNLEEGKKLKGKLP